MRALLALVCLTAVSGFRHRQKSRANRTGLVASDPRPSLALKGPSLQGADCDQLQDIVVGGYNLSQGAVLLCRFWPAQFGEFPVDNANTVIDLFNGATDLWEKIQELLKGTDAPFCWKKVGMRQRLSQIQMHGVLQMNSSELDQSECDMQVFGTCYGPCPAGMKNMALIGSFAPVCSSSCIQSTHETPCAFGCSTGIGTCFQTLMDQSSVVLRAVGQVASYLSGNPLISAVVDQVLRLIEFAIDVVFDVVRVAKHVWSEWPREQVELGIIIALLQFVLEHARTIGQDLLQLNEMFGETMEMILELIDAEFDWQEINLEFITDTILKHGMSILGAMGEFAEAFVFPQCEVVSNTNPDYDCNGNGSRECGDWNYGRFRCNDNNGQCEYRYKFGDMLLDQSCRCKQ